MDFGRIGIRSLFRVSILIVVVIAFLALTLISFTNVTDDERSRTNASMRSEVNYLCLQLESLGNRADAFNRITSSSDIPPEELRSRDPEDYRLLSDPVGDVLSGYTLAETGTVALIADGVVIASDDERVPVGSDAREVLGDDVYEAIGASLQTGELQAIPYGGVFADSENADAEHDKEAYLLAGQQGTYTVMIIEPASMVFKNRNPTMGREAAVGVIILIVVFLIVDRLLSLVVARRIDETNEALVRITGGNLEARVEDKGTREFRSLSRGINTTVEALQGWIAEAETRMDSELAAARSIQESALPNTFPPYPNIEKFDIFASMNAAREVGGDFYDFFLIGNSGPDSGKLAFLVADVSGKGVPAALFMMKAATQIRDYLHSGMEVAEAVENVNRQLVDSNDASMFVTAWVGVLDYATGHVDYVNAGHNPPLLWQKETGWDWLKGKSGLPLGLFEGLPYQSYSVDCEVGSQFLIYSDGVTEAMNVDGELYGEERLMALANENFTLHPRMLVEAVRDDVARHAGEAEQSDDITILSLEVGVPPEITATLVVPAETGELARVNEFIHAELDRRLCPLRVQNQLDIAVEELFVNVCHYAYVDAEPDISRQVRISYTYNAEPPTVTVDIADHGIPYNPLAKPDPARISNIEDAPIGGLGILMAKRSVDEMRYEHTDGSNIVTLVKRW